MKHDTSTIAKVFLLFLAIVLSVYMTYYKLFLKQNYYMFNYFQTIISIKLGDNEKSLDSNTINAINNLLKSQEDKWFPKPGSYLVKLNQAFSSATSIQTDDETIDLINKIKFFHKSSNEYFNPTLDKLISHWKPEGDKLLNLADYLGKLPKPKDIQVSNKNITSSNSSLQLNINGIITAHILNQIQKILVQNNVKDAEIGMGNDLYIIKSDNSIDYRIVEKNTSSKKMPKLFLKVYNNEFLSTSGVFIKDNNNIVQTIINPKTGKPSNGFYGSTIIDKDPYNANVASIAMIIAGPDNYIELAKSLGIDNYILYTYDNKIIISEKMRERMF